MSLRRVFSIVVVVTLMAAFSFAQTRSAKTLDIYVIDVEGGNATLFVPPSGEAVLIDTGNVGAAAARDAARIQAAMKDAGIQQIDHLITTHWHGDHFGGMAELASHVTIKEFIDHGGNVQPAQPADTSARRYRARRAQESRIHTVPASRLRKWIRPRMRSRSEATSLLENFG